MESTLSKAAFFSAKVASADLSFYSASESCFFLGSTTNKASYVLTTALIHNDNEPAALEALKTFYFSNSGFCINVLSFTMFLSGMALILSYLKSLTL